MKGYEVLSKVLNDEIKPKTIIKTEHESQYFDDYKTYDYYLVENDKRLHRCNEDGKLGSKYQDKFLNYKVLEKDFEIYKIIEEDKKIEKISWSEKESLAGDFTASKKQEILARRTEKLKASLNELIDEVNKLKEGK